MIFIINLLATNDSDSNTCVRVERWFFVAIIILVFGYIICLVFLFITIIIIIITIIIVIII